MLRLVITLGLAGLITACGATRKISHVEVRQPASTADDQTFSILRTQLATLKEIPHSCPKEIRELLPTLAAEKVEFPDCPDDFATVFQRVMPSLKLDERSTLEEALNSQCRSVGNQEVEEPMESMLTHFDSTGPAGRSARAGVALEGEEAALKALRVGLEDLVSHHLPLSRWIRRNGEFLFGEEELELFAKLFVERKCRLTEEDLDNSYRAIRAMEELTKILKDGPQRDRIESFLDGFHQTLERKIQEFFYP
jgi:hypothetical protein